MWANEKKYIQVRVIKRNRNNMCTYLYLYEKILGKKNKKLSREERADFDLKHIVGLSER